MFRLIITVIENVYHKPRVVTPRACLVCIPGLVPVFPQFQNDAGYGGSAIPGYNDSLLMDRPVLYDDQNVNDYIILTGSVINV